MSARKHILIVFCLGIMLGITGSSMVQSTSESFVQEDTYSQNDMIIEGERQFIPSSAGDYYIGSVQSLTYGFHSTTPPSGMGANNNDSTTLIETQTTTYAWSNLMTQATFGSSLPPGWSSTGIYLPGDGYFYEEDDAFLGDINCSSVDTTGSIEVRFTLNIQCSWNEGGISVYFWDGSNWDFIGGFVEASEGDQTFSSSSSEYCHSNFRVKVTYGSIDKSVSFKANNWRIDMRTSDTYYAFQAVYKFTGVDYDTYLVEELHVDFAEDSSSDTLVFRFASGNPNPSTIVKTTAGNVDFSVNIHSYLTGSDCYVDIRDAERSGDLSETTWKIQRMFIRLTNSPPAVDTSPVTSGLVSTNKLLAEYNYVTTTVTVSDPDGYSHINYVTLSILDDSATTTYFKFRFDESTSSFSVVTNPENVILGTCSSVKSSTNIDLVFNYTVTFDCPQISNSDYLIEIYDDDGEDDWLSHEANWDTVTSFALDGYLELDDGVGTPDRGNINGAITATGTLIYSGLPSYHPRAGIVDIELSCVEITGSPWTATSYHANNGSFVIHTAADDAVGIDVYTLTVKVDGEDRLDAVYDAIYISDQIICVDITSPSFLVDSSAAGLVYVRLQYVFDGTNVTDGTYQVNGLSLTYLTNDLWTASETPNTLTHITYNSVTIGSANIHGITSLDMNSQGVTVYWDQLVCFISNPTESPINPRTNASGIYMWAEYYYASLHPQYTEYTGSLQTNDTVFVLDVPGRKGYNISSAGGDDIWGVFTIYSSNATYCIWDYLDPSPSWVEEPTDQASEYLIFFSYEVNATAPSGLDMWWVNDTIHFTVNLEGIISNSTTLIIGTYPLQVFVNDTYGRSINATFLVTVQDTTAPTWLQEPSNRVIELGDAFYYDLDATDPSGIDSWWLNTTAIFDIGPTGIIQNITSLNVGKYALHIFVNDIWGNVLDIEILVTVQDTTAPTWINSPADMDVEFGEGLMIQYSVFDLSPIAYWTVNNTALFSITETGLLTNATRIQVGVYCLTVNATDAYSNTLSASIKVKIQDTTPPSWVDPPGELILELGDSLRYDVIVHDLSPIALWWINDTDRFSIDTTGRIRSVVSLNVDRYPIMIAVEDLYGNALNGLLTIVVVDTTPPSWITTPQDQVILYGTPLSYRLVATDLSGIARWAVNDTARFRIDSEGLLRDVDTLEIGVYHVEITVYDKYDNHLSVVLMITVRPLVDHVQFIIIIALAGAGISTVMFFMNLRTKKLVEKRSLVPTEGKEDLSTALDYLDKIQEDQPPPDDE